MSRKFGVTAAEAHEAMLRAFGADNVTPRYVDMHVIGEAIPRRVLVGYESKDGARPTVTCFYCGSKRGAHTERCVSCGAKLTKS